MDLISALLLGLVEGVTEFIPISSTGHLIVVGDWLNLSGERTKTFEIFIQLGAILAIVWLYRGTLAKLAVGVWRSAEQRQFVRNLALASLPAGVAGVLLHDWIKAHLFHPGSVAGALVAGGIAILLIERWSPKTTVAGLYDLSPWTALGIGAAQALALFPGVSRSGATIMGAYALGLSRQAATEFSFFLALPVMAAATLFDLVTSRGALQPSDAPGFAIGFVVAFASALLVVKAFLVYVSRHDFRGFAWYRIGFGGALLLAYARWG